MEDLENPNLIHPNSPRPSQSYFPTSLQTDSPATFLHIKHQLLNMINLLLLWLYIKYFNVYIKLQLCKNT